MADQDKTYVRFTLAQRLEHWIMTLSFTVLTVTGLPQRYALANWAEVMIDLMGGIELVRLIHRVAAVVFMVVMIYHFISVAYKLYVLRVRPTMMPTLGDAKDLLNSLRYYLGLSQHHPRLPRYNFAEKIEYWAVIWGGVLMALTGFMLWNPIATASLLPGEFIPAARAAHSAEALLAFLAIIIWHVYWVHLKTFNRSMFTGTLTREQMLLEHAAELDEIETGRTLPRAGSHAIRQRQRVFTPVAAVLTLVMLVGLVGFVTFEQTAITTVPPAETAQAFVPATPTPTNTPPPTATPTATPMGGEALLVRVPMILHPVAGREDCLLCHAADGPLPNPEDHAGYSLATCQFCHSPEDENPGPNSVKHSIEGRDNCTLCHQGDLQPVSHQEMDFADQDCLLCHQVDHSTSEETVEPDQVTDLPPIPHALEGREDCLVCHSLAGLDPFPADHEDRSLDTCQVCHDAVITEKTPAAEPAESAEAVEPDRVDSLSPIPHAVEGREDCLVCHGPAGLDPFPADHEDRSLETCQVCHKVTIAEEAPAGEPTDSEEAAEPDLTTDIPLISHALEGREDCLVCHSLAGLDPYPADHEKWNIETCQVCHKPQTTEED